MEVVPDVPTVPLRHTADEAPAQAIDNRPVCWYVMRDLKRPNAKHPAYAMLAEKSFEVFTPMQWQLTVKGGRKIRERIPVIRDLLFVHASMSHLDEVVDQFPTLQYRYLRGGFRLPMTVSDREMERFIRATEATDSPCYYLPDELTPDMCGRRICIVGGPLNGCEGTLLTVRGSKVKRLLVEIPSLIAVAVEVSPEFVQIIK